MVDGCLCTSEVHDGQPSIIQLDEACPVHADAIREIKDAMDHPENLLRLLGRPERKED